jgi:hypothetical protein
MMPGISEILHLRHHIPFAAGCLLPLSGVSHPSDTEFVFQFQPPVLTNRISSRNDLLIFILHKALPFLADFFLRDLFLSNEPMDVASTRKTIPCMAGMDDSYDNTSMGMVDWNFKCQTCGAGMSECRHFGHIELARPVFHPSKYCHSFVVSLAHVLAYVSSPR